MNQRYQTFWPRFWAGWVDAAVFFPFYFLGDWIDQNVQAPMILALWLVVNTLAFDVYSVAMHAQYGQTLGKMVFGVKVLDISETKLSLPQALLRESVLIVIGLVLIFEDLPRVLAGVGRPDGADLDLWLQVAMYSSLLWFAAELLTMLTNSKRRALHDFIAGSVVVRTRGAYVREESGAIAR